MADSETATPDADGDAYDDDPLHWYVVAAYMLLVIGGFALAVWFTVGWYGDCHSNSSTGRSASYAGDSARGTLCHAQHGLAGLAVPVAWLVGLALATFALLRWGGSRLKVLVLALVFLAPALLPVAAYAGLGLSGTDCTGHRLTAYRHWVDAGGKGRAPYDCRKF